jgi:hypothetical protein
VKVIQLVERERHRFARGGLAKTLQDGAVRYEPTGEDDVSLGHGEA